jgi:hypothetical protein
MTLVEMVTKLDAHVILQFEPKCQHPENSFERIPNPNPWSCRRYDYSNITGHGLTPEDACANMIDKIIESARQTLSREIGSVTRSNEYVEHLVTTFKR